MGLYRDVFRFSGPLPSLAEVHAEAARRLGGTSGIESIVREGDRLVASSLLDPYTREVLGSLLVERGGQLVDRDGGTDGSHVFPAWATQTVSELGWRKRTRIRLSWWVSLVRRPA